MTKKYFIIDFDSTFIQLESLDELARIVLEKDAKKETKLQKIKDITVQGMEGKISFSESLAKRMKLFNISKDDIDKLIPYLKDHITGSVARNVEFFSQFKDSIYIISGGFSQYIYPIVKEFGIAKDHVLANSFIFKDNKVVGYDTTNPLAQDNGKAKQIKKLALKGTIYVIGDGYTDYEAKEKGNAHSFFAMVENIKRDSVMKKADVVVSNFDELLFSLHLPRAYSFPKSKMKVLLLEKIHPLAVEAFKNQGYDVETLKGALDEDELALKIKDISILGIRSKTEVTEKVLKNASKLLTIGAFCIGTNQIDLQACTKRGICVFNAPYSNTRSVVELVLGEIIMLSRKAFDKSMKLHKGDWDKSADNCHELRGKKLGIVGYGNIGSQLSVLAEMMGIEVYFYDVIDRLQMGNAKKCASLQELLKIADIVTIHVDGRGSNKNLIAEEEFKQMKDGVIFLNLSRGFIVDVDALAAAITSRKVAGAAVDVFPKEPKSNDDPFVSPLQGLPNVILTPHIGGSTEEAQKGIAEFVSKKITEFIDGGTTTLSVNLPNIQLSEPQNTHRFIHLHENVPGMLAQINNVLAQHTINIENQYLKTNEQIGYVITDVNKEYSSKVVKTLREIPGTIKLRVLY